MPTIKHRLVGSVSYRVLPKRGATTPLDIEDGWESRNIVEVMVPQLRGVKTGGGTFGGKVRWFKGGAYQLLECFKEIEARGLLPLIRTFDGAYYPRLIRGARYTPSEHSFGTALDINYEGNELGAVPAATGQRGSVRPLVPIFEKWGFRWGGYFSRKDGMHFELARLIAPATQSVIAPVATQPVKAPALYRLSVGGAVTDVPVTVVDGRALVPIAEIAPLVGWEYLYDAPSRTVNIWRGAR